MRRLALSPSLALLAALLVTALPGCASKSPEERVAEIREAYSAKVNSFIVEEEPLEPEAPMMDAEGEAAATAEAAAVAVEDEELEEGEFDQLEPVEVRRTVVLDILIQHRSAEKLDGVTVDITHVDASEAPKGSWRVWFDTAGVPEATPTPYEHELVDIDYVEGDGFHAEVRHPVPAEERGEYREFSPAS